MISIDPAVFQSCRSPHSPVPPAPGSKTPTSQADVPVVSPTAEAPATAHSPHGSLEHRDTMMKLSEQMGEALSLASYDPAAAPVSPRPTSPPLSGLPSFLTSTNSAVALDDLQATLAYMLQSPRSPAPQSQNPPMTPDDAVASALNEAMSSSAMVVDAPVSDQSAFTRP